MEAKSSRRTSGQNSDARFSPALPSFAPGQQASSIHDSVPREMIPDTISTPCGFPSGPRDTENFVRTLTTTSLATPPKASRDIFLLGGGSIRVIFRSFLLRAAGPGLP